MLLIEDDASLAKVMVPALESRGYSVELAVTGAAGLEAASVREPDMVILDLGLPDIDGLDVCERLRRWFANPILVLSADGAEDRKVAALDLGADDYVTKPFSTPELLARLRVALRHRPAGTTGDVISVGDVVIDTAAHEVTVAGAPVDLARKEMQLLVVLARNAGRVLTHGALFAHVWGGPDGDRSASLRVLVNGLRVKLGTGPSRPSIVTELGVGYRLVRPD